MLIAAKKAWCLIKFLIRFRRTLSYFIYIWFLFFIMKTCSGNIYFSIYHWNSFCLFMLIFSFALLNVRSSCPASDHMPRGDSKGLHCFVIFNQLFDTYQDLNNFFCLFFMLLNCEVWFFFSSAIHKIFSEQNRSNFNSLLFHLYW